MEQFNRGDRVRHAGRPEWGGGVVDQAVVVQHEGKPAQRLVISFANRGRVTVNTGMATLERVNGVAVGAGATGGGDWLSELEGNRRDITDLSDAMSDVFLPLSTRVANTIASFRFNDDARGLMDWACAQTGLDDPLSHHSRSELEEAYRRYRHKREQHLTDLVKQARQTGELRVVEQATLQAPNPAAREALRKALRA